MAILGTGIDIIEIQRIKKAVDRNGKFLNKVFTSGESDYFDSRRNNPCHIAGAFAAKEAVLKALGTGLRDIDWKDIEILRDTLGKPHVALYNSALVLASNLGIKNIHISISHSRDYAVAHAVAEGESEDESCKLSADEKVNLITNEDIYGLFPRRKKDSNKGTYGKAFIIAGSMGMMGAAVMSGLAALRSGAGLVELAVPACIQSQVAPSLMEAIVRGMDDEEDGTMSYMSAEKILKFIKHASGYAVGPGLSKSSGLLKLLGRIIEEAEVPGVIDADGLNLLAQDMELLNRAGCNMIVTPHPGEMARLTGMSIDFIQKNRIDCARDFSMKHKVVTVLKGANTVVASPEGEVFINATGNPGMARGGSGDVLTGIIVSLLAQGIKALDAAKAGVYIHGLAGDMASCEKGEYGMKAGDIIDNIPYAIRKVTYCAS